MREVAGIRKVRLPYALVVWVTIDDMPEPGDGSVKRWLSESAGAVHVWFALRTKDLLGLPSQLVVRQPIAQKKNLFPRA